MLKCKLWTYSMLTCPMTLPGGLSTYMIILQQSQQPTQHGATHSNGRRSRITSWASNNTSLLLLDQPMTWHIQLSYCRFTIYYFGCFSWWLQLGFWPTEIIPKSLLWLIKPVTSHNEGCRIEPPTKHKDGLRWDNGLNYLRQSLCFVDPASNFDK